MVGDSGIKKKNPKKHFLIIALIVLIIAIVGLIVGIIVVNIKNNQDYQIDQAMQDGTEVSKDASAIVGEVSDNIVTKMETDPNYNVSEAEYEFESEIVNIDSELKVYMAISYANFIYEEKGDAAKAIKILKEVEQYVNDQNRVDYYVALRYFYKEVGDEKNTTYYSDLIEKLVPDLTQKSITMEGNV